MKKNLLLFILFTASISLSYAQYIFDNSVHTASNFSSVNSTGAEGVQNIIDQNTNTEFLAFDAFDGIGFEVGLLGVSKTAIAIEIVTANDASERDTENYEIFGYNDGTNYTSIVTGAMSCIHTLLFPKTYSFTNSVAYTFNRVNFKGTCGTSEINQILDVQLFEAVGDSPVISCPANINMTSTTGQCGTIVSYSVSANDSEDGMLTASVASGLTSGSSFPVGVSEIFMSVTDSDNNTSSCSFTITIVDNEAPIPGCPADITVTASNSNDTSVVVDYTLNPTDNCVLINPLTGFTPLTMINGKAYYLSDNLFAPQDGFSDAITQGGFVGTIRTYADFTIILQALNSISDAGDVLIGYNDVDSEGTFVWHSGDSSNFNNWNSGEPNNSGANGEDYTLIQGDAGWNDVNTNLNFRYLFEIDYAPIQITGIASGNNFPIGTTTNTFQINDLGGNSVMCSFDVTVNANLSIPESKWSNGIFILPNPANQSITINSVSNSISLKSISIIDLNGKTLFSTNSTDSSSGDRFIDISSFATGMYLVKLEAANGQIAVKKLLKL
jgi:hypothetical protein